MFGSKWSFGNPDDWSFRNLNGFGGDKLENGNTCEYKKLYTICIYTGTILYDDLVHI